MRSDGPTIQWNTTQPQRNELLTHTTRMSLTCILLSERSQTPKTTYSGSCHDTLEKREIQGGKEISGCMGLLGGWAEGRVVCKEVAQGIFGVMELSYVEL